MAALDALRQWGSDWSVLTLGEQGALFAAGERRWSARPPKVEAINPIGSGDAMTAGLMAGLVRGLPPEECFRLGMATAAANTLTWDACRFDAAAVEALLPQVETMVPSVTRALQSYFMQQAITASAHRGRAPAWESAPGCRSPGCSGLGRRWRR